MKFGRLHVRNIGQLLPAHFHRCRAIPFAGMLAPMTKTKKTETSNLFWTFFSSVKLTIVLLMVLAAASVAGTLLPQGQDLSQLADGMSPGVLRLLEVLDLFDMYHAWWFRWLIGLLSLNLIVCSVDRFPSTWRRFKTKSSPDRAKPFEDLPSDQSFLAHGSVAEVTEGVHALFRKSYGRAEKAQTGEHILLFRREGPLCPLRCLSGSSERAPDSCGGTDRILLRL